MATREDGGRGDGGADGGTDGVMEEEEEEMEEKIGLFGRTFLFGNKHRPRLFSSERKRKICPPNSLPPAHFCLFLIYTPRR